MEVFPTVGVKQRLKEMSGSGRFSSEDVPWFRQFEGGGGRLAYRGFEWCRIVGLGLRLAADRHFYCS